jgi:hypothetical protein
MVCSSTLGRGERGPRAPGFSWPERLSADSLGQSGVQIHPDGAGCRFTRSERGRGFTRTPARERLGLSIVPVSDHTGWSAIDWET